MAQDLEGLARLYLGILQRPPTLRTVPNDVIPEIDRVKVYSRFATFIRDHPSVGLEDYLVPPNNVDLGCLDQEERAMFTRRVVCQSFSESVKEVIGYQAFTLALGSSLSRFQIVDHRTIGRKILEAAVIEVIEDPQLKYFAAKKYAS